MTNRSTVRLFLTYAAISLVPVLVLGLVLAATYRSEARRRGLAAGRAEAALVARTAVEPLLDGTPLGSGLSDEEQSHMGQLTTRALRDGDLLRLRLRSLTGRVVFAEEADQVGLPGTHESLDAAEGRVVAKLTHLETDQLSSVASPAAVEVYLPLVAGEPARRVGVLEIYLPYAPINADVSAGLQSLYKSLAAGLLLLWLALFAISASVSRRLRREVAVNAFLAEHDALTSLPNRSRFRTCASEGLAQMRRTGVPIAVAIVDLDRFKEVNDTLGHRSGDEVLVEIGRRLRDTVGPADTVARLGGDEFGIVLADGTNANAALLAIREVIGAELTVGALPLSVESSIGFVLAPEDGHDVDALLQRADVAMYLAKARHTGVAHYDALEDHYDASNLGLIGELRPAIASEQLVLHYQPKATVLDGGVESVEALVRWQHPAHGLMLPARFLPRVEQTDLIHELTAWVLRRALLDVVDLGVGVAVNVSARDLSRRDFADRVRGILHDVGVAPELLTLEITETAILVDPARAAEVLGELEDAGVRVSIDDFGQGQTSLGYLSVLPVHELKVDRQFVDDMLTNHAHGAIVRSIIDLGHNLGMQVVAEGVERQDVLDALRLAGCDTAQGFLLARPMSIAALPSWLAASRARV
ncbi:MAG: diguanylate cyclase/phosphodiesterase [Acidimicrobiales bacterium]|nr:diguanylate cyclase/phosphodiesterase [Acidimicrobiales bacterium]